MNDPVIDSRLGVHKIQSTVAYPLHTYTNLFMLQVVVVDIHNAFPSPSSSPLASFDNSPSSQQRINIILPPF